MTVFLERVLHLLDSKGVSKNKMLTDLHLGKNSFVNWTNRDTVPGGQTLQSIANYFSVSVDYLLGKSEEKIGEDVLDIVNGIEQRILESCNGNLNIAQMWQNDVDALRAQLEAAKVLNTLTDEESAVLNIFRQLPPKQQTDILKEATRLLHQKWLQEGKGITIRHSVYKVSAGNGFPLDDGDCWENISIPDTPENRKANFALTIQGDSMEPVYHDGDIVLVKQQDAVDLGDICVYYIEGSGYIKKYGGDRLISLNAEYGDILFKDYSPDAIRCFGRVIGLALS